MSGEIKRGEARRRLLRYARVLFETALSVEEHARTGLTVGTAGNVPLRPLMVGSWERMETRPAVDEVLLPIVCDVILGGGKESAARLTANGGDAQAVLFLLASVRAAVVVFCDRPKSLAQKYLSPSARGLAAADEETRARVTAMGGAATRGVPRTRRAAG